MSLLLLGHRAYRTISIGREEKRWASPQELGGLHISELRGRTVGMLPYGAISREVARMAKTFGARIVGELLLLIQASCARARADQHVSPPQRAPERAPPRPTLDTALPAPATPTAACPRSTTS